MDKNSSYNDAVGAVEASVFSLDTSKLCSTLQRFPVLQVFAAQRLIHKLAELKSDDALGAVVPITEVIGCIILPRGSFTAECRICATNIFYSIRDRDESVLQAILKRMIVAKRLCDGCGLFVYTVISESLKQCGVLAGFIADHLNNDETRRYDTGTHFWTQVFESLQRESLLKGGDHGLFSQLRNVSLRNAENDKSRRLILRTYGSRKWRKRQRRKTRLSSEIRKHFHDSHSEQLVLLTFATLHAVCPDIVSEKLDAKGLKSYCATRVRAFCDSVSSSQQKILTPEDVLGLKWFANTISDPQQVRARSICKNSLGNELVLSRRKEKVLFAVCKPWMPLDVSTQSTIKYILSGELVLDTVLDSWSTAEGNMRPLADQVVMAALRDEGAFQKLTTSYLYLPRTAKALGNFGSVIDTQKACPIREMSEYLQCLELSLTRGVGYPSGFWDQTIQVLQSLTDVIVWTLLQDIQDACKEHVEQAVSRIRSVEKQLQDHVEYQRIEPRKECAVLRLCDCSSVEMTWKHLRRSRFTAWRKCRCMIPNTVFVRVPNPKLWFSWVRSVRTAKNDSRSNVEDSDSPVTASLWLYGNPAWRGAQRSCSEREILRCIIDNALQDETGDFMCVTEDVLAYVLRKREARENMLSDIVASVSKITRNWKQKVDKRYVNNEQLHVLRKNIERLWSSACQESNFSKLRHGSTTLMKTSSADARSIETMLAIVAPCPRAIHDCIRDMPTYCEYIALIYEHLLLSDESVHEASMHVRIIAGLTCPNIGRKRSLKIDRLPQTDSILESVMGCFE